MHIKIYLIDNFVGKDFQIGLYNVLISHFHLKLRWIMINMGILIELNV